MKILENSTIVVKGRRIPSLTFSINTYKKNTYVDIVLGESGDFG